MRACAPSGSPSRCPGSSRRPRARSWSRRTSAGRSWRSRAELEARLDLPVHVENESNLAALAEHWTGAAVGIEDFVCVFGEVGVGGGIVLGAPVPWVARLRRRVRPRLGRPGRRCLRVRQPRLRRDARRGGVKYAASRRRLARCPPLAEPDGRARPTRRGRSPGGRAGTRGRGPLSRDRPRVDLQPLRRPGRGAGRLLRASRPLARGRGAADAREAIARRPFRVVRRPRLPSATGRGARRRGAVCTGCSMRRGRRNRASGGARRASERTRGKEVAIGRP